MWVGACPIDSTCKLHLLLQEKILGLTHGICKGTHNWTVNIYYQTKLISTKRSQNLKTHIKTSTNSKVNIKELKLTKQLNIKVADKSSSPLSAIACKK